MLHLPLARHFGAKRSCGSGIHVIGHEMLPPCKQRVGRDTQEFQALIATMVDTRGVAASSLSEKARGTQLYLPFDLHACIDLVLNEDSPGACFNFLFYPEEEENYIRMMIALGKHS